MKWRALIVDDEYPARRALRSLLNEVGEVEVVGEATHGQEALTLLRAFPYDLVFLDIRMPGEDGLEVAQALAVNPARPEVVFTTAYSEFAVDAFDVDAVDYLLKPVDESRLRQALEKVRRRRGAAGGRAEVPAPPEKTASERIPAEHWQATALVDVREVVYAFSKKEKVYIRTRKETLPVRFTLVELEERLRDHGFIRVHRQYLVNLEKVKAVGPYRGGTLTLIMADAEGTEIPVSRIKARAVRKALGL